jgi:N-acetylmuramoyl-L-alanine amidase
VTGRFERTHWGLAGFTPPLLLGLLLWIAAGPLPLQAQKPTRPAPVPLVSVRNVSRTLLPRGERIAVEFTDEVSYSGDRLPNPDRIYLDFKNSLVSAPMVTSVQALGAGPLVGSIRIARHTERTTRLVLTLTGTARYSVFPLYNPFRLVIDVESDAPSPIAPSPVAASVPPADTARPLVIAAPATSARSDPDTSDQGPSLPATTSELSVLHARAKPVTLASPAGATTHGDYSLARQLGLGVSRIVIDAGHGGHDPGAQSNGLNESELVLDVALRLGMLLEAQPGIAVVLTRNTDEFIPLEERTAMANREGADLFLSIHANASRQPAARGVETYFLNFATNPAAEAVAARENATSTRTMGNLPELVKTIALNNKVVESRELATIVQTSLMRRLRVQNQSLKDLGVKQAPFVVLIGAQMPSVLAEISFLTNKPEASLLKQSGYRQRIAQALCDAVLKYQGSLKKVTTLAVKDERR